MTSEPITRVLFRVVKSGEFKGSVDAMFPDLPGTNDASTCACYAHIGQHGSGAVEYWQRQTRNATPEECAALQRELRGIGYRLQVVASIPRNSRRNRIKAIEEVRT